MRQRIQAIRHGVEGGFVATLVMTAFRIPISRSLPPTAEFWQRFVHDTDSPTVTVPAIALHLLYGVGGGVAYSLFVPELPDRTEARAELWGVLTAVAYSLCLSAFGQRVVLGKLLGQDLTADEAFVFHLGHVVYGLTLGAWAGSRSSD